MKSLFLYPSMALILFCSACKSSKESSKESSSTAEVPTATSEVKPTNAEPPAMSATVATPETKSGENAASATATQTNANQQDGEKKSENMYRLIISFISIGEGTDQNARAKMDGVLSNWEKKKGAPLAFESIPWGREGEVDFCFILKELSPKDQEMFIKDMKNTFKGNSLVQIAENQKCMHKR